MGMVAITCNGSAPHNLYPTFIMASAAAALGDEVLLFFTPSSCLALKKGFLETLKGKGKPDMADLLKGMAKLNVRLVVCALGLDVHDLKMEDLREGVEIMGATSFMDIIRDAHTTLSF
ncbi:DsrE/DsrF/DrsH-like family protein [Myxococcota bacterium]|nr:DsrE/DsrF/DrsH-like family protein [Myxococcota bacterium]